jgi:dTDP-D-glucose 4,6-dehydratase
MRVFVTGGAGFIGSNFIRWVLGNEVDVRVTNYHDLEVLGVTAQWHSRIGKAGSNCRLIEDPGWSCGCRLTLGAHRSHA